MCLKEPCFPDGWKVSWSVRERSTAKSYCPVSVLYVVSNFFEKHVDNRIVDCLEKCGFFF